MVGSHFRCDCDFPQGLDLQVFALPCEEGLPAINRASTGQKGVIFLTLVIMHGKKSRSSAATVAVRGWLWRAVCYGMRNNDSDPFGDHSRKTDAIAHPSAVYGIGILFWT